MEDSKGTIGSIERIGFDVQDLRADTLRFITFSVFVLVIAILWLAAIDVSTSAIAIWPVLFLLVLAAGGGCTPGPRQTLRALWLITGLGLAVVAGVFAYPSSQLIYSFSLLVLITSVVLGKLPSFAVAAVASGIVLILAQDVSGTIPSGIAGSVLFLIWATALLSCVAMRPTQIALDWAWKSYVLAMRRTEELRDRQGELGQLAKSLGEACGRLEQMNWELERARRTAEEARRLKAEFAAAISHELRTPLNLIIGFSDMMLNAPVAYDGASLPDIYREDLEAINRNACHISRLVDDVLDLSQIEAHRMALERSETCLNSIAEEAAATVAPQFKHLGLRLTLDIPANLPHLYVDPNRIRQILINLLNNAARFTDHGGVTIGARNDEHDVTVIVADTGVGIAAEDLPNVFQEFRQVGPIGRRHGGSGLGLAICKQFAEMHGGSVWVESQLGHGSVFSLSLPLSENVVSVPVTIVPSPRPTSEQTIAVLDRDPETARVFQRYLDGYHIVWAENPTQLRHVATVQPLQALILADADAETSLKDLLSDDVLFRNLPVFTCSLKTRRVLADELGVAQYLVKPISRAELATTLRRLAKRARNVLIVEDDPEMGRFLTGTIAMISRRYRVCQANNGTEAISILHEKRPDLVLLDLLMPHLDGYGVLQKMKSDTVLQDIPVVIISAKGAREETMRTSHLGVNRSDGLTIAEVMRCLRGSLDALLELAPADSVPRRVVGPAA